MSPAQRTTYGPFEELVLARVREFYREPAALFWVYGFPMLMVVALGVAFRERRVEQYSVDIVAGPRAAQQLVERLRDQPQFQVQSHDESACRARLRTGRTDLIVLLANEAAEPGVTFWFDPTKPGSMVARDAVNEVLQREAGRRDSLAVENRELDEPGGRYIDFLIPGLLGMSLMGGGMWGVGFVTVDMRIRKLLKRFLATPMKRRDFLASIMVSRMLFMVPEVLVLLIFSRWMFGVVVYGNLLALVGLILLGAVMFSGIGLLLASRARTLEAISGLMNLFMLPMWIMSGIFFSTERFPAAVQPILRGLPLTPLIHALRAVMLEGSPITALGADLAVMLCWSVLSFAVALRFFRWN